VEDAVTIPPRIKSDGDDWRSTTVLPFLKELYYPSEEDEDDDSLNEMFEGINFGTSSSAEKEKHESKNGNNNEILQKLMTDQEFSQSQVKKRRCLSSKTSTAGRLLSCLGVDHKCKQS